MKATVTVKQGSTIVVIKEILGADNDYISVHAIADGMMNKFGAGFLLSEYCTIEVRIEND